MRGLVARQMTAQIHVGPDDALSPTQTAPRSDGKIERAGAPKVIVVEDEVLVAWFVESLLLDMKLEVAEIFSTGEAALAAADRHAPDLIMMDINLGAGIDGVETAVRWRQKHPVPVIFFSAYASETVRDRIARDLPDARLVIKPASPGQLQKTIESALQIRH